MRILTEGHVCDVCEDPAVGSWSSTEYLNGDVFLEGKCPLDLCEYHMRIWATSFSETMIERGENISEIKKLSIVNLIKEQEEHND